MLLFTVVKIAQIQQQVNKSELFSRNALSNNELFHYLDSLVKGYSTKHIVELEKYRVDLDLPLNSAKQSLSANRPSEILENKDFHLVEDFNLIDFASFLDSVIKTISRQNQSNEEMRTLATKNIFRTHVNQQVSKRLGELFIEDHLDDNVYPLIDSLASSNIAIETTKLYDAMSDETREHFYIFDIDGTLKEAEMNCISHGVPNISNETKKNLVALNNKPNTKVIMLTSRCSAEIKDSNVPYQDMPVLTGYGKELLHGDKHEYLSGQELMPETEKMVCHVRTLLQSNGLEESDFTIRSDSGAMYILFNKNNFADKKLKAMKTLALVMENQEHWKMADPGIRYVFINDSRYNHDKGVTLEKVLVNENIGPKSNVYVLGDTSSDYKAMEALKRIDLPQGARKFNIAAGNQLDGKPAVTNKVSSYQAIEDLLSWLKV